VWLEGRWHLDAGRWEAALDCFRQLTDVDADRPQAVVYDTRLFGSWARAASGAALYGMGRYADAAQAFAMAERLEPAEREHPINRRLSENAARSRRRPAVR
jgi:tetratricopeptide (TPR) repeat protein